VGLIHDRILITTWKVTSNLKDLRDLAKKIPIDSKGLTANLPSRVLIVYRRQHHTSSKGTSLTLGHHNHFTQSVGVLTETIAYSVTSGIHFANRDLWKMIWRLAWLIGILMLIMGMLLMRTIDREWSPPPQKQNIIESRPLEPLSRDEQSDNQQR
jgi:hypothetical protein